jgi:small subunit ribosomal protein S20
MANNSSAKKRIKINNRNRLQNYHVKSTMKTFIKKYFLSVKEAEKESEKLLTPETYKNVKTLLDMTYSKIDKALKKKIIHRNKAARKKSQLIKKFKNLHDFYLIAIEDDRLFSLINTKP